MKETIKLKVKEIENIAKDQWYPLIFDQIRVLLYLNKETAERRNFIKIEYPYYKYAFDLVEYWLAEKQEEEFIDKIILNSNLDGSSYLYSINSKWILLIRNIKKVYNEWYLKIRVH